MLKFFIDIFEDISATYLSYAHGQGAIEDHTIKGSIFSS